MEGLVASSPRNHGIVERGPQLVQKNYNCHINEVYTPSHPQYSDGDIDNDGGALDRELTASRESAQAYY